METPFIPPTTTGQIEMALGAAFVMVFGWQRFNRPVDVKAVELRARNLLMHSRCSTTAISFFGALLAYQSFLLVSYFFLQLYYPITQKLAEESAEWMALGEFVHGLSAPLVCALVLTMLLPSIPHLKDLELKLRDRLQKMAAIPRQIYDQAAALRSSKFRPPAAILNAMREGAEDGVLFVSVADNHKDLGSLFVRATALVYGMRQWTGNFSAYISRFPEVFAQIEREHETAKQMLQLYLDTGKSLGFDHKAALKVAEQLNRNLDELLTVIYEFISGGVLSCELTATGRVAELQRLGFESTARERLPITLGQVSLLLVSVWMFLLLAFSTMRLASTGRGTSQSVLLAAMVSSMFCAASLCAMVVWKKANRPPNSSLLSRPWHQYMGAALLSLLAGTCLSTAFNAVTMLLDQDDHLNLLAQIVLVKLPWQIIPMNIAFWAAFCMDNREFRTVSGWKLNLSEGLLIGATSALFTVLARRWLGDNYEHITGELKEHLRQPPQAWQIIIVTILPAFGIGYFLPGMARRQHLLPATPQNTTPAVESTPLIAPQPALSVS